MDRNAILAFLKEHKQELHQTFGVRLLGLFGSYAKQTERPDSDIDLVVEFDSEKKTLGNFLGLKRYLEKNLGKPVDVGTESALKPILRKAIQDEIIYV